MHPHGMDDSPGVLSVCVSHRYLIETCCFLLKCSYQFWREVFIWTWIVSEPIHPFLTTWLTPRDWNLEILVWQVQDMPLVSLSKLTCSIRHGFLASFFMHANVAVTTSATNEVITTLLNDMKKKVLTANLMQKARSHKLCSPWNQSI